MIPMEITPEEYATYHSPSPNYLYAVREAISDRIGNIIMPDRVVVGQIKHIGYGRVLKVSPYRSDDEWIEEWKTVVNMKKYITFEFHAIAEVHVLPQFKFPRGVEVIELHIKDITGVDENINELLERQKLWESSEEIRLNQP